MSIRVLPPDSPASRWLHRSGLTPEAEDHNHDEEDMDIEHHQYHHVGHEEPHRQAETQGDDLFYGQHQQQEQQQQLPQLQRSPVPSRLYGATMHIPNETASSRALRKLPRMMVHSDSETMDLDTAYLMRDVAAMTTDVDCISSSSSIHHTGNRLTGRKRKMYETCGHCQTEFEPGNNQDDCCVYHPGQNHPFS